MEIKYSEIAVKQIKTIAKSNKKTAEMIFTKIENYAVNPNQFPNIKKLKGRQATFKRLRAGDYRVIFDDEFNVMLIYQIKHRKDAYK
jgi:mRNA interferase RelE/StbE